LQIYVNASSLNMILVLYSFAVERGLMEIKRLDIETQLWDESRRELEQDAENNSSGRSDF